MFIDSTIDFIQTSKKNFVNTVFGKNETVAAALNEFVDAQTEYTKSAVKAGTAAGTKLSSAAMNLMFDAAKYDYSKAFDPFSKMFTSL